MNRLLTLLTLLFLTSLACSMPANVVLTRTPNAPKPAVRNTPNALVTAEVIADEALHVRKEPLGIVIGYLYHGDIIELSGRCQDGWAQIRWKNAEAWVKAKYLSTSNCQTKEGE